MAWYVGIEGEKKDWPVEEIQYEMRYVAINMADRRSIIPRSERRPEPTTSTSRIRREGGPSISLRPPKKSEGKRRMTGPEITAQRKMEMRKLQESLFEGVTEPHLKVSRAVDMVSNRTPPERVFIGFGKIGDTPDWLSRWPIYNSKWTSTRESPEIESTDKQVTPPTSGGTNEGEPSTVYTRAATPKPKPTTVYARVATPTPTTAYSRVATPTPTSSTHVDTSSTETDRDALVALYHATDGPNWEFSDYWLSREPIGEWDFVYTNSDGRVGTIESAMNGLKGEIPPELGNLTSLNYLMLSSDQLTGRIPPELGNLSKLEVLYLDSNQLSGKIPSELGKLAKLEVLDVMWNQLSGEIPPELGRLADLEWLLLGGNQLSGEIPPELGKLTNLESLYLDDNQLSGEVPTELGNLPKLKRLKLDGNRLRGCVPSKLKGQLDLSRSDLGGLPFCYR